MANKRPIETYYGRTARRKLTPRVYDAKGRATTPYRAVLAAAARILEGQWKRCDIYVAWNGRRAYTVQLAVGGGIIITRHRQ